MLLYQIWARLGFKPINLSELVALVQLLLNGVLVYTDIRLEKYSFRSAESFAPTGHCNDMLEVLQQHLGENCYNLKFARSVCEVTK